MNQQVPRIHVLLAAWLLVAVAATTVSAHPGSWPWRLAGSDA